ncbi:MAG: Peptidase rhomboid domain protein [Gemmatimonadetes bacterium]|nr:Peptidase rhomboid domain protein [Gemmatimonadota bacterium]
MTPWVLRLLIANVFVYFVQQTVPGVTNDLAFVPTQLFVQPWTLITYMFLHGSIGHLFFNMLALYFFGSRVEDRLGPPRFFALYFISGIAGGLLSYVFSPRYPIIGASGAVFGVSLAFARFWPRDQILIWGIIPVEARWLIVIMTAMALFGVGSGVAHFAHLGGFLGGYLYLLYLERNSGAARFKRQVTSGPPPDALATTWQKVNRNSIHSVNKDEVNRILDKISASGIKSLTPQERLFLSNFVPMDDRPKPPLPPS